MYTDYETTLQRQPFADVFQNRCSYEFCHIHGKTLVLESYFNNVAVLKDCNFIKKRTQHRCFPVNIAKFLRTAFFTKHLRQLLLYFCNTTLENIARRNGKKRSQVGISNSSRLQFMKITIFTDILFV